MRVFVLGVSSIEDAEDTKISAFRWLIFLLFQALATGYLAPLEVISTRLSIQPNNAGFSTVSATEGGEGEDVPEGVTYAGTDEDVIGLRPTTEPYGGMIDCARKLIEEEGWQSLYRGWWWTMGSNVMSVFAT